MGRAGKTVTGFSIGEVEKITGIRAHVLRYWEQEQPFLRPQKDTQGRRLYTDHHLDLIFRMKYLVEVRKFTVEGAGQQLLTDLSGKGGSRRITELSHIRSDLLNVYRLLQENKNAFKAASEA
ncbi:MerR family transcriptional regulator [Treponema sp.]|uniref:MerR family transcriptional regulator n=1 Tax=Treponema sp. TaxID=166 RepID=UPI003FA2E4D7